DMSIAGSGIQGALLSMAPAVIGTMAIALVVNLAQTRGLISFHSLKPSFKALNPKNGLRRVISVRSLWELAKQLVRVGLLGLVAWQAITGLLPLLATNGPLSSLAIAGYVGGKALGLAREVAEIGLVLAALDYVVQFRKVRSQLRMTKQEVKEENKQSDGNPQMKGAIRRRQRQMARNRMMAAVAAADAVVVNPTHFAVALRYQKGKGAPRVVAKGTDLLAMRIREEALERKVPVVEDPPLARALYVACELEREIPKELYEAVARLLTFVYTLAAAGRGYRIDGAPHKPAASLIPRALADRIIEERGGLAARLAGGA
ncbi:MAG TPA: EscU/YscU/HrcU family type III secretion system export apparatus switch protein, partial [Acidimicrobiales bacterium]|nr:EscU/YscU/HrcU family type III secretion system export apparatus switch protein [Acidimicrobiales bacterium]